MTRHSRRDVENGGFGDDFRASVAKGSIGHVADERATVGWRNVWAVVKARAERRIGRPVLVAYLVLALFGIVVVAVSIVVMHL
jgi:hypothetical protein